ncbi:MULTISPECIES: ATP-binding protein [Butyricimonas]|uniref:ATP-binding protein n=1 Tax=Butyricimonas TaxID=574697 RepID=UPI001D072D07|nr:MULTISPECIES: AAA family ATPase [Butyricimonas]MCB6971884.1 AAA family ATPase [Butyricimonas synergistica]MCG4518892.1 AAA family ATPase [Butyricimonas sp. DFI.6.44]
MYKREQYQIIKQRIEESRHFLQVVLGPRQVGKTTVVKQVLKDLDIPFQIYSADNVPATQVSWISDCWNTARAQMRVEKYVEFVLVIDEIQKIKNWSEVVKKEWDEDTFNDINIKVLLLGSSRVLLEKGLSDSMMGRFEEIRMTHWSYPEMRDAFGMTLEQYIFFGGYPGAAFLIDDEERWSQYINSAIIDATINKDILYDSPVGKPALLRQAFELGSSYSGEIVSLTKMVGALQDAGNTTTLASYLNLLGDSGLLGGLQKFTIDHSRQRASAPKFQVYNNALKNIYGDLTFKEAVINSKEWGRIFESAIGAHIISNAFIGGYKVFYWRERDKEVDYILQKKSRIVAIEVKSNREKYNAGLEEIRKMYNPYMTMVVGDGGMKAEDFLSINPTKLFE